VEQYRAVCLAVLAEVQERRKRRRALTA